MYRARPGLLETPLEDELVLLDTATRQMYSLNRTGGIVWRNLADPQRAEEELARAYGIPPEQAEADVRALLERLLARDLIERV
ncbi:MAG TPA: PqqD family protein [Meiothermus sp.]|jgi:hypothetical protein|nr:PqqD family protein [Meiothermus sp.]